MKLQNNQTSDKKAIKKAIKKTVRKADARKSAVKSTVRTKISRKKDPVREDPKNVALPKIVEKVIDVVKDKISGVVSKPKRLPFGGKKGGRKKKQPELSPEKQAELDNIRKERMEDDLEQKSSASSPQSSADRPENAFFYSNDKFLNSFEDDDITDDIKKVYPKFDPLMEQDSVLKKAMFEMLQNENFVSYLLQKYNMNIQEFFKYLIRKNQSIFTKQCVQRVQRILKSRKYDGAEGI